MCLVLFWFDICMIHDPIIILVVKIWFSCENFESQFRYAYFNYVIFQYYLLVSIGIKTLNSSTHMFLNCVLTLIPLHSIRRPSLHLPPPLLTPSSPHFIFLVSILILVTLLFIHVLQFLKTPKSQTLTTLKPIPSLNSLHPHPFWSTTCFFHLTMAPKEGFKHKGKKVACNDSPSPRFDHSTYHSQ